MNKLNHQIKYIIINIIQRELFQIINDENINQSQTFHKQKKNNQFLFKLNHTFNLMNKHKHVYNN
jgi:hypothetical protein